MANYVTFEEFGIGIEGNITSKNELEIFVPSEFFMPPYFYGKITFSILFEEALLDTRDVSISGYTYECAIDKSEDNNIRKALYKKTFEPEAHTESKTKIFSAHLLKTPSGSISVTAENKDKDKTTTKIIHFEDLRNTCPR